LGTEENQMILRLMNWSVLSSYKEAAAFAAVIFSYTKFSARTSNIFVFIEGLSFT
jgi:hypothetical protein